MSNWTHQIYCKSRRTMAEVLGRLEEHGYRPFHTYSICSTINEWMAFPWIVIKPKVVGGNSSYKDESFWGKLITLKEFRKLYPCKK